MQRVIKSWLFVLAATGCSYTADRNQHEQTAVGGGTAGQSSNAGPATGGAIAGSGQTSSDQGGNSGMPGALGESGAPNAGAGDHEVAGYPGYVSRTDGETRGAGQSVAGSATSIPQAGSTAEQGGVPGCQPTQESCDGFDNDCDGDVDEGCPCVGGTLRNCGIDLGLCSSGTQTCTAGVWGKCSGVAPTNEICDGADNDCDGDTDEGFNLSSPCDSTGKCPQSRVCSTDHLSSACINDARRFEQETCDGIDNDCDSLVDEVVEDGALRSVCSCLPRALSIGEANDTSVAGNTNLCADTKCAGDFVPRLVVDGKCYPVCTTSGITSGDSWSYENGATCLVAGTPRAIAATVCPADGLPKGMAITYCLDCRGTVALPYAMCDSAPRFDLTAFGQGKLWLRVDYTYSASGAAQVPVNLWFNADGGRRKYLPLVSIGDTPARYQKVMRVNEACYSATAAALFGNGCPGNGQRCTHCGNVDFCGAIEQCGQYDLSNASLQVAAEFCGPEIGFQTGTVTLHLVELVQPICLGG